MDEDAFLVNAALGTDLLTSYAGASGDDDPKPPKRKGSGCFLLIVAGIIVWTVARAVGF